MPSRILRDGILTSVPVNSLSQGAELFYRRLMSVVDDYGRYYSNPAIVRAACFPLKLKTVSEDDVVAWLIECTKLKLVLVYQVDGKDCLEVGNFKQQTKTRPKFPAPPQLVTKPCTGRVPPVNGSVYESVHLVGGEGVVGGVVEVEGEGGKGNGETLRVSPPACPAGEIVKLYAQHLPMGRQVRPPWNGERAKHLQARWREDKNRWNVSWWDEFFGHCAKSAFLTGRVPPRQGGRKPFEVSIDWIVSPSNFQKIIEGAYDD